MSLDHGPLSGIRRRSTPTQARREAAGIERSIDNAMAEVKAAKVAEDERLTVLYAAKYAPVPFTEAELKAARAVRTRYGWHGVVRVNAKTVTIRGDFGNDRIPTTTILEVKV